jgi:hypothetical protein
LLLENLIYYCQATFNFDECEIKEYFDYCTTEEEEPSSEGLNIMIIIAAASADVYDDIVGMSEGDHTSSVLVTALETPFAIVPLLDFDIVPLIDVVPDPVATSILEEEPVPSSNFEKRLAWQIMQMLEEMQQYICY